MGLDQFAFSVAKGVIDEDTDFRVPESVERTELKYWRKHPNLHGFMEKLYRKKGGKEDIFNVVPVRLNITDLEDLRTAIENETLPHTEGFFFGNSWIEEEKEGDLQFVNDAIEAINNGEDVYYDSWW